MHTERKISLCGRNVKFLHVKSASTWSNDWAWVNVDSDSEATVAKIRGCEHV